MSLDLVKRIGGATDMIKALQATIDAGGDPAAIQKAVDDLAAQNSILEAKAASLAGQVYLLVSLF